MSTIDEVTTAERVERKARLREELARRFGYPEPGVAHNLLVVRDDRFHSGDSDSALHRVAVLSALLDEREVLPLEVFGVAETRILWLADEESFYLTRRGSWREKPADPALVESALSAAHHVFPQEGAAGDAADAELEPADTGAREAEWMADLPVLFEILAEVVGIEAVRTEQVRSATTAVIEGLRGLPAGEPTPREAWLAMVDLHCRTNAYTNDFAGMLARLHNPPRPVRGAGGLLGELDDDAVGEIVRSIHQRGFHVFEQRLPEEVCDRLLRHSLEHESLLVGDDKPEGVTHARYDRQNPIVEKYVMREPDVLCSSDVREIISDPSILRLTQSYLGTSPVLDLLVMWWNTTFADRPSDQAAMLYHFDMHRVGFLKWFFYLTDVTPQTGPHCVIAGSHRRAGKPPELLERGFVRISDEDLRDHYAPEQMVELCGPRGTIIAVDTRAFHKGKLPEADDRLVLQFQMSTGLFGAPYRRTELSEDEAAPLREAGESIYRLFLGTDRR